MRMHVYLSIYMCHRDGLHFLQGPKAVTSPRVDAQRLVAEESILALVVAPLPHIFHPEHRLDTFASPPLAPQCPRRH